MSLQASVYVVPPIPVLTTTPHTSNNIWQPISTTLIYGEKEAILVDTAWSVAQSEDLVKWLDETLEGRNLTTIYVTHGHGDHFFGGQTLKKHFPHVKMVATADTVKHMQQQVVPAYFASFWEVILPADQLGNQTELFVEALPEDGKAYLEGHLIQAIQVGQGDTYASTVVYVPSLHLVVCGDVVYGHAHQWLVETTTPEIMEAWIAAIDFIEALRPEIVIAGHKKPNEVDGAYHLKDTKQYIRDFRRIARTAQNSTDLYEKMLKAHPGRLNPYILELSTLAYFANHTTKATS